MINCLQHNEIKTIQKQTVTSHFKVTSCIWLEENWESKVTTTCTRAETEDWNVHNVKQYSCTLDDGIRNRAFERQRTAGDVDRYEKIKPFCCALVQLLLTEVRGNIRCFQFRCSRTRHAFCLDLGGFTASINTVYHC
jgi:hypothetical protein